MLRLLAVLTLLFVLSGCRIFADAEEVELEQVCSTCGDADAECGSVLNSCGNVLDCGSCSSGLFCGGEAANQCSTTPCTPETDAEFCARLGKDCEVVNAFDNCGQGRSANCGECDEGVCGTETPNVCPCEPLPLTDFCAGVQCGSITALDCGVMRTEECPSSCDEDAACEQNVCVCDEPDTDICGDADAECGVVTTMVCGAETQVDCGGCTDGVCENNQCCKPLLCGAANGMCAPIDMCSGAAINCGLNCLSRVSVGASVCSVNSVGEVHCWGDNREGSVGVGAMIKQSLPRAVAGVSGIRNVASGRHGVLFASTTEVYFMGGIGSSAPAQSATPRPIFNGNTPAAIQDIDHYEHSCVLFAGTGSVYCWGANKSGQVAAGEPIPDPVDQPMRVFDGARDVTVGASHTCALTGTEVFCWGSNSRGQVHPDLPPEVQTPMMVPLGPIAAIDAGPDFTCAITDTGGVACWGANDSGQLNTIGDVRRHEFTIAGERAVEISAGERHACVRTETNKAFCWGSNDDGEITPTSVTTSVPATELTSPRRVLQIAAGDGVTCAVLQDGGVACQGANEYGEIGSGTVSATANAIVKYY